MQKWINKLIRKIEDRKQFLNLDNKVIIYQMGKVGSTSLDNSISNGIHRHNFYPFYNQKVYTSKQNKINLSQRFFLPIEYFLLRRYIKKKIDKGNEIKVITLVREPISRNISFLFQFSPIVLYNYYFNGGKRENMGETLRFMEKEFYRSIWHTSAEEWFDQELKKVTGINIFDHKFDQSQGYSLIKKNNINLLVLKMESLNDNEKVIGEFIGDKNFKLKTDNISSDKWYKDLYKTFKANFKPTQKYINSLYNTRYMKHFYSKEEIDFYKDKWLS